MSEFAPLSDVAAILPGASDVAQTPTKPVTPLFQLMLSLANVVVWLSIIPLYQLLLPAQVAVLDPQNKISTLSFIIFIAGVTSVLAQPFAGAFSDRTTSRFGRRRPWIIAGMLLVVISLLLLANAPSIPILAIELGAFGLVMGMVLSPVLAIIPDMVPVRQRATVSAFVGLAQPVGTLIGIILIAQVIRSTQISYYAVAGILFVVIILFALFVRETPLPKESVPPFSLRVFLRNFFINPVKYPDFGYTWLARFLVILAQTILVEFILFYLHDVVHYESLFPGQTAQQGVSIFQGIYTVTLIVSTIVSGILSDRLQRRKIFVVVASIIMTVALLLLAFVPGWPIVLVVAAVFGVGFGIYISADIALATQVLPQIQSQGKDLGFITAANILPELLFPVISFVAFGIFHGYPALFTIAAVATLLGALCILPIKGVR